MWQFTEIYTAEEILALTGIRLTLELVKTIYTKYCGKGTLIDKSVYRWWLLYPISRACRVIHGGHYRNHRYFQNRLHHWQVSEPRSNAPSFRPPGTCQSSNSGFHGSNRRATSALCFPCLCLLLDTFSA